MSPYEQELMWTGLALLAWGIAMIVVALLMRRS